MTSAQDVLNVARAQIGVVEGPGSNNVRYNTWYYGSPVHGDNFAWCAVFVSWCAAQAGAGETFGKMAYCPSVVNRWKAMGRWGSTPQIGAQVVYEWPSMGRPCHTGIVESISRGGIVAIEGNTDVAGGRTGGRVLRVARHSSIVGYGYPNYGASSPAAPAAPVRPFDTFVEFDMARLPQMQQNCPTGANVRVLQGLLKAGAAIRLNRDVDIDGEFGPGTDAAVREYQTSMHLGSDGVVGIDTWTKLMAA